MTNYVQVNLNHCRSAQDLLAREAVSRRIDIAIVIEPYGLKHSASTLVDLSGKAAIQIFGGRCAVGSDAEQGDGFVVARINGVNVFSCYFSPNRPVAEFAEFARSLEICIQ